MCIHAYQTFTHTAAQYWQWSYFSYYIVYCTTHAYIFNINYSGDLAIKNYWQDKISITRKFTLASFVISNNTIMLIKHAITPIKHKTCFSIQRHWMVWMEWWHGPVALVKKRFKSVEWVSEQGSTSHSAHNRSFWRGEFPAIHHTGNQTEPTLKHSKYSEWSPLVSSLIKMACYSRLQLKLVTMKMPKTNDSNVFWSCRNTHTTYNAHLNEQEITL